ncbi:MAG: cob(I)yrinic acid a,c-diamide adenosyltransferase, partial [Nitrospirota bacterium]
GKTTASVGLAIRARSRGFRVLFAQFMKESPGGEGELLRRLSVEVLRFSKVLSPYFHPEADRASIRNETLDALADIGRRLGEYDLVVLDEFNCLLAERLLTEEEALAFLEKKPGRLDLVLTGRGAPQSLVDRADHVVEVREVKRPAGARSNARRGIEY